MYILQYISSVKKHTHTRPIVLLWFFTWLQFGTGQCKVMSVERLWNHGKWQWSSVWRNLGKEFTKWRRRVTKHAPLLQRAL